ncbi:MAG: hypothetical protein IJ605_05885 [Prevotella sp.]|nr:hypothetical protein [Prevotella sp.]
MKKIFTPKSLLVAAFALLMSADVFAGTKYTPVYGQVLAYPTGAGKVYGLMNSTNATPDESTNYSEPSDVIDVKFVYKGATPTGWFDGHAVAEEGWVFAGFAEEKYVDGEPVLPEEVEDTDNPANLRVRSAVYTTSNMFSSLEEAQDAGFPEQPDVVYYALFTHVTPRISEINSRLGAVSIDKTVNYVGQEVTITAEVDPAAENYNTTFSHWVEKSTGKVITENPYTFTVEKADEYEAVFNSDLLFEVEFPEDGGYVEWYHDCQAYFPTAVEQRNFLQGYLKKNEDRTYFDIEYTASYIEAKTAGYLYGKGKQTFMEDPTETEPSGFNFYGSPFEDWSGEEGVMVDTLTHVITIGSGLSAEEVPVGDITAYLFDEPNNCFNRVEDGFVPANRVFLAIPQQIFDELEEGFVPDVIYLTAEEEEIDGIGGVKVGSAVKNGNTYTIDGRMVSKPNQKGVYIYDGKKLILRK